MKETKLVDFHEYCIDKIKFHERFNDDINITIIRLEHLPTEYFGVFRTNNNIYEMHKSKKDGKLGLIVYKKDKEIIE